MRIVSHRSWTLGYTWGRASLRLICCGMRDALVDRKHELKRLLLRVPASAPLRYADRVEAAGVALFECVCELDLEGIVGEEKARAYVTEREQSTSYKIRNLSYSQMQAMRNYSSEIAGVSLPRAGIRVSWRVLMSKARLSTPPGTASILNADTAEHGKIRASPC